MGTLIVGIGFYRREQWPLLVESAVDSHVLERTYDEWLDVVDASIEKIKAHGIEPELVNVDIEELLSFCSNEGLQNDASARSKFIAKKFGERRAPGKGYYKRSTDTEIKNETKEC